MVATPVKEDARVAIVAPQSEGAPPLDAPSDCGATTASHEGSRSISGRMTRRAAELHPNSGLSFSQVVFLAPLLRL